jgi:hypothetical protein
MVDWGGFGCSGGLVCVSVALGIGAIGGISFGDAAGCGALELSGLWLREADLRGDMDARLLVGPSGEGPPPTWRGPLVLTSSPSDNSLSLPSSLVKGESLLVVPASTVAC